MDLAEGPAIEGANAQRPTVVPPPRAAHPAQAAPEAKVFGLLTVESDEAADVLIDAQSTGRSVPLVRFPVAPGAHTVTLVAGNVVRERQVVLKAGEEERLRFSFASNRRAVRPEGKPRPATIQDKGSR